MVKVPLLGKFSKQVTGKLSDLNVSGILCSENNSLSTDMVFAALHCDGGILLTVLHCDGGILLTNGILE